MNRGSGRRPTKPAATTTAICSSAVTSLTRPSALGVLAAGGQPPWRANEPSAWLRDRITAILRGPTKQCGHVTPSDRAIIAAWQPNLACCPDCAPRLRLTGIEDYRCDRCGDVDPETHALLIAIAPAVIMVGLCGDCYRLEVPA